MVVVGSRVPKKNLFNPDIAQEATQTEHSTADNVDSGNKYTILRQHTHTHTPSTITTTHLDQLVNQNKGEEKSVTM